MAQLRVRVMALCEDSVGEDEGIPGSEGVILPALQAEVLRKCEKRFSKRQDIALALSGSIARGAGDKYSDIDFELVCADGRDAEELMDWVREIVGGIGVSLASFAATHLSMPHLLVFFREYRGEIVKIDVNIIGRSAFEIQDGKLVLWDPGGILTRSTVEDRAEVSPRIATDFGEVHQRFCGWIWYTYSKIARGEYFEAGNSLEVMMNLTILPCLQLIEALPREGLRRIEERLSPPRLKALRECRPASLAPGELTRALLSMVELFDSLQPLVAEKAGSDHRKANFNRMRELLLREMAIVSSEQVR
jgi:predicted nucleotidyltransferase